jgi:diguanylate cyclase (GGDEF)-like protein
MMYFAFLTLAVAVNAVGYMYEVNSANLEAAIIACKVTYLGSPFVGPLYLMFALDYINKPFKKRWLKALIFVPAAAFSLAVFTYPDARLYYSDLVYSTAGWQPHLVVTPGPLYYPCFIYEFTLAIAGAVILIRGFMRAGTRRHALIFPATVVLPIGAQIINFAKILPGQLDIVPTALTVTVAILSWHLARYRRDEWQSLGREHVVQNMNVAFILIDTERRILDSNNKAKQYFPELADARPGARLGSLPGFPADAFTGPGDLDFELKLNGERLFLHMSSTELKFSGSTIGSCLLMYDDTKNHMVLAELNHLARHDELTGLNNRSAFFRDATRLYDLCRRQRGYPGSALMMDIDHFKSVNDTYGHAAGDDVLREIGGMLGRRVRRTDICGRYGGEELCVWLPSTNTEGAIKVAEDVRVAVKNMEFTASKGNFKVTISIGIASADSADAISFDDVVKRADEALYRSKRAGRDRVSVYGAPPETGAEAVRCE